MKPQNFRKTAEIVNDTVSEDCWSVGLDNLQTKIKKRIYIKIYDKILFNGYLFRLQDELDRK